MGQAVAEALTLGLWSIPYAIKSRDSRSGRFGFHSKNRPVSGSAKGFSLIELLIVVAIILIIAAIAIPNLLRSRMAANEASAVGSVRTINTSEVTYFATWGVGYGAALSNLGGAVGCTASSTTACLLDPVLSAGSKSGYTFAAVGNTAVAGANQGFEVNATPSSTSTGTRSFCSDQSGVIRYKTTGAAVGTAAGSCAAVTTVLQ
jgi:prepilin-type N-terminal cleavage/methylation domain-containing protein